MSRLNRLLTTFGPPDRTWCCERCRAAAFDAAHATGLKHAFHPGETHTDLPELATKAVLGAELRATLDQGEGLPA